MTGTTTSVLKELLTELRLWRSSPSRRERIARRPPDREHPDPTPVEMPIGYETPPSLAHLVQMYVRQGLSDAAHEQGLGTFEEEDDFEVGDPDDLPVGSYEVTEYQLTEEYVAEDAAPPDTPAEPPPPEAETPAIPVQQNEQ